MRGGRWTLLLCLLGGCSVTGFEAARQISGDEGEAFVRAAPFPEKTPRVFPDPPARVDRGVVKLDLPEALRLSLKNNQRFLVEGEQLDLQLLTLEVLRHRWQPAVAPLLASFSYTTSPDAPRLLNQDAALSVSQRTMTGGLLSATWVHTGSQPPGRDAYTGTGTVAYTQPVLRGAGSRAALEELVGEERRYVYARRFREFNRITLLIQTVESYFGLLNRDQSIRNFERNLQQAKRQALAAELLERFGGKTRADVFRAQLQVTIAERAVAEQREQVKVARDVFKVDLGLRPDVEIELVPEKLEYRPVALSEADAIAAALEWNPSFLETRDRVEDARRALALADNASLPRLDVTAAYTWASDDARRLWSGYDLGSRDLTIGGALEVPLDTYAIRRDYQKAVIGYRQSERELLRARDRLEQSVRAQITLLRQAEVTLSFQERAILQAERTARLAEFEYGRGRTTNRDVLEAQEQLLQARNDYEASRVTTKISQLRLLQFIGRLETDDAGAWLR